MDSLSPYAALGALLTFCACGELQPNAETTRHASQALKDASVSVRTDIVAVLSRVEGTDSWCTGVVLEPGLVLTAQHWSAVTQTLRAVAPRATRH